MLGTIKPVPSFAASPCALISKNGWVSWSMLGLNRLQTSGAIDSCISNVLI